MERLLIESEVFVVDRSGRDAICTGWCERISTRPEEWGI
jgi:hypothetical protein